MWSMPVLIKTLFYYSFVYLCFLIFFVFMLMLDSLKGAVKMFEEHCYQINPGI